MVILPRLIVIGFFKQRHDVIIDRTTNRMRQRHLVLGRLQQHEVIFDNLHHACGAEGMSARQ
jgi:hypothetical protein